MTGTAMDPSTEIRKLRPAELYTLGQILDTSDSWKQLMAVVPKEGTNDVPKFNSEHFAIIERAVHQQKRMAAEIFLEEWGTMGRQRPTLQSTLTLLVKAELFRAADFIAVDLLKEAPPRRPVCGPAAPVDTSDEAIARLLQNETGKGKHHNFGFESDNSLECNLDDIAYPSDLTANHTVENQNIENSGHCHRDMSTLTLSEQQRERVPTNLMQFSTEISRNSTNVAPNSDLIKFSSSEIHQQSCAADNRPRNFVANDQQQQQENASVFPGQNFQLQHYQCLPTALHRNINSLQAARSFEPISCPRQVLDRPDIVLYPPTPENSHSHDRSSDCPNANYRRVDDSCSSKNYQDGAKADSEPRQFNVPNERTVPGQRYYDKHELDTYELPVVVAELDRNSASQCQELRSQELPQFVADIARLKSTQSSISSRSTQSYENYPGSSANTGFYGNSADFPNFDAIRPENIPVCVDSFARSQENNEMLTAELPQFVADLSRKPRVDSAKINNKADSSNLGLGTGNSLGSADVRSIERYSLPRVDSGGGFYNQNVALTSQELPVVVLECNNMRGELDKSPKEVEYSDLPRCVAEL